LKNFVRTKNVCHLGRRPVYVAFKLIEELTARKEKIKIDINPPSIRPPSQNYPIK